MSVELCHECLAESHNFCIALAVWIEVRTALAAADRETCQGVLEDLLESEELDDSRIYVWSKSESALVRSDCAAELISVALVDLYLAGIVNPYYSESNSSFRLNESLKKCSLFILRMLLNNRLKRSKNLFYCLVEFNLARIVLFALLDDSFYIICHWYHSPYKTLKL